MILGMLVDFQTKVGEKSKTTSFFFGKYLVQCVLFVMLHNPFSLKIKLISIIRCKNTTETMILTPPCFIAATQ